MCIRSGISFIKQTAKQLTYHWVYCFLREQSRSLDTRQIAVPKLPFSSHPAYLLARFNRLWQQEIQIEGRRPTKFALCRCLSRTFAAQLAACVGLRLLVFAKDVGLPLLLSHIIYSLDYRQPADLAGCIWLLVLYLIASVLAAIVEQNHIDVCDQTTLAISNTLLCAVHQIHSTGSSNRHLLVPIAQLRAIAEQHGTDLFSCGIQSTADLAQSVVQLANSICTPVRLFFGVYVFYRQIGWPIVPGIAITLLYLPIRSLLLHRSASAQRQASGASARRIALISHLIDNIVPIRLLGWCNAVTERIGQIRVADELLPNIRCSMLGSLRAYLWKSCRTGAPLLCLAVYSIFAHGSEDKSSLISAERVYIVQTAMRELIPLLIDLPHAFDGWWAAQQPFRQVSALLSQAPKACLKDKQPFAADSSKPACAISITRMTFTWPAPARSQAGGNSFALSNVTMHVSPGQLVAIVGGVSAGKSSLLAAMLGEMDPQCLCPDSSMRISRRVALVAQSPWILNASIQDNITFGQPFHHAWFHRVIRACELSDDFQVWEKQGRLAASSVGSGGMALSGGQRMRIALARAVYSRPSVVLLDSILSAVDVRVAQRLLDNVLLGPRALLSKATRVVATNHHALINAADAVYSIDQTGRVSKLPLTAVKAAMPTAAKDATVASPPLPDSISDYMADSEAGSSASTLSSMDAAHPIAPAASPKGAMDPVRYMLRLCGASRVAAFFAIAIAQCFAAYQYQHWKSQAVPPVSHGTLSSSAVGHLAACASWWLADNVLELAIDWWSTVIWKRALFARSHHQLLSSIALNMPLRQFAVSSTGKILSLFTNAQSDLDTRLPLQLSNLITFAIKIIVETWVILNFHPILVLSVAFVVVCMWQIVRLCQLPLKHLLERKSRMYPLIHKLYQESLSGATTIRAFETGGDFMQQQLVSQLDEYSRLRVACDSIETWIDLSMTVLREVTLFVALAVALLGPRLMPQYVSLQADSAQIIMVHSAITLLLARLQHSIRHSHLLQSVVESTNEYVRTVQSNQHAQCPLDDSRLWLKHWKISGAITFKNVCASYSTALSSGICPLALQNMSFAIRPGQHVGIVGRTGSGKTSIAMALMGLLQPHSGRICIDNIDLSQIPKSVLPEYLTVVPQSAYIMPGTIRDNLDPYGRHSSTELKKALSIVNLQTSLDTVIDNWSWGQKQLLGIARALLRKESSSILILDEATSSLDLKQSQLVNQAIRSYYRSRTVITIAHRLESVMDCQLILVVHQGAICELGSPQQLLASKNVTLNWDIGYLNISRDGFSTWQAIGVNNALPIPPVHLTQGDILILNVHNSLDVVTSVHAHGLYQVNSDYYDGAAMITGCGVPPGHSFTYIIDTGNQKGTFWLHGHFQEQFADGLRAPLIIHEPQGVDALYDEEILFYLEDWAQIDFMTRINTFDQIKTSELPPFYPTILVNGMNGNSPPSIKFEPQKRYRIRVVSMSASFWFRFSISGHKMQIIEVDGVASEPKEVDGLDLGPGQRYSAIVTAHDTDAFNYLYNVTLYANFVRQVPGLVPRYSTGLVSYKENAPINLINSDDMVWSDVTDLQAKDQMPLLPVDRQIVWSINERSSGYGFPYFSFGDYAFSHTMVPTLFTALTTGSNAFNSSIYGHQAQAHVVRYNENIEILVRNDNSKDHSLHIHMLNFQIVEAGSLDSSDSLAKPTKQYPMRCDTVTVRAFSYVKIRFHVDRGFVAIAHCHMAGHRIHGLAATIVAAPDLLQKHMRVPESVKQMCSLQGIGTFGNAAGNIGFDMTGLPPAIKVTN
ncbi:Multidrug resistance-associated protein 7 [Coemansia brasiliensis]|uniref:Multidrug resistance-associated protein 7 n=1 Tax=Coemansia brasiliensis TaxID=2650707 RepID=A0A9W8M1E9_9FUNG|nr:Multidrug resistance-associated protein 7 [Coemansia brasiliensis]